MTGLIFEDEAASLRYDPSQRLAKMQAWREVVNRLDIGDVPESISLLNVGVPMDRP